MEDTERKLFEVVLGSYDQKVGGFYVFQSEENKDEVFGRQSFSSSFHAGSIKCIAASKRYLASGSTDESIHIFDLKKRIDLGPIHRHEGTITCLKSIGDRFYSSSEDKTILVWHTKEWECIREMTRHKDGVISFDVHPSEKLLISIGKDKTIRTWALNRGKCVFITNLRDIPISIKFTPNASKFLLVFNDKIDFYDVDTTNIINTYGSRKPITEITFLNDNVLLVGKENGEIEAYDMESCTSLHTFDAHEVRIKGLKVTLVDSIPMLVSASSDGLIKFWRYKTTKKMPVEVGSVKTNCRINCIDVFVDDRNDSSKENQTSQE